MCGCYGRRALTVALVLLATRVWAAVSPGQPLAQALETLRGEGLQVIFSSALIQPQFKVDSDPGAGTPEEVARRILAPYGLTLQTIHPGFFSVVRVDGATRGSAAPSRDDAPASQDNDPISVVNVYASRYAIDAQPGGRGVQFTRQELSALPGINEDVLRVTRYLPGTASNALSARTHVRGGRENELAVYFDGAPLFEPFHFKDVQSLLGMLEPQSISTVDFYSGVVPARYGNQISGVLDLEPREWSGDTYNAIGASVLYTHALSQGRLKSVPLEWLVSVRRGNVDLIAEALDRDETRPRFLDALGRLEFDPEGRARYALGWLLLDDTLEADADGESAAINHRDSTVWLDWHLDPDESGLDLSATLSRTDRHTWRDGSVARPGSADGALGDRRQFDTTTGRLAIGYGRSQRLRLTGGLEWYDYAAKYDYHSEVAFEPALAAAFGKSASLSRDSTTEVDGAAYAAYASALFGLTSQTMLEVGARWDGQRFGAAFHADQLSPRVSLQYQPEPATTLRLSWGKLSQTQRPDELAVQDGDAGFFPAQRSTQVVLSLEKRPTRDLLLRLEAYDKRVRSPAPDYENLLDPFALLPELAVDRVRVAPDESHAHGVELSMRWELPPDWLVWTSYSLAKVSDDFGTATVPRTWDQRHSLVAGLNWSHGPWGASLNSQWHSGWRRNELLFLPDSTLELAPRNSRAWRDYSSLDARGTWARPLTSGGALQLYVEVDNLANRFNACCSDDRITAGEDGAGLSREITSWLPRIYLIGATWQLP
jgi:hypothetical protein